MRYGLPKDDYPSHRSETNWKISVENNIAELKLELLHLKHQLMSSINQSNMLFNQLIEILREGRNQNNFAQDNEILKAHSDDCTVSHPVFGEGIPTSASFLPPSPKLTPQYEYTTFLEEKGVFNKVVNITGMFEYKDFSPEELRQAFYEAAHHNQQQLFREKAPSPKLITRYKPTTFLENYRNLVNITELPEYKDLSPEEIRLAFYDSAYTNQQQLFGGTGLEGVLTGTGFIKYSPIWVYDPVSKNNRLNCISTHPTCNTKSLEELRYEDYILKKQFSVYDQCYPVNDTQVEEPHKKIIDKTISSHGQEELLNKMLSQLEDMNRNMTAIKSKLSTMDINLSEMKSQMSVMDSRLSAVDMFVTMQQVDKSWKELTSRLQTLENPLVCPKENKINLVSSVFSQELEIQNLKQTNASPYISPLLKKTMSVDLEKEFKCATENAIENLSKTHEVLFIASKDTILISHLATPFETNSTGNSDDFQKKAYPINFKYDETKSTSNYCLRLPPPSRPLLFGNAKLQGIELYRPFKNNNQTDVELFDSAIIELTSIEKKLEVPQEEIGFVVINHSDFDHP